MKRVLSVVVIMIAATIVFGQSAIETTVCDRMPVFPGGNAGLLNYLSKTLKYPKEVSQRLNENRVLVKFTINSSGYVTAPTIVRSAGSVLDSEAIRVVKLMPRWSPGYIRDKPVSVIYTLPILICLED